MLARSSHTLWLGAICAATLAVATPSQGTPILVMTGAAEDTAAEFGSAIAPVGDLDGDGVPDLAIGIRRALTGMGPQSGRVALVSGADGTEFDTIDGGFASWTGHAVAAAGDVDGDGIPDFVVGAPSNDSGGIIAGRVRVVSGADRSILFEKNATAAISLGWDVDGAGDVDADGYDDWIAGAPFSDTVAQDAGSAYVWSGRTGNLLHELHGDSAADLFGFSVAGVGDCNLDGFDDIAVGALRDEDPAAPPGTFDQGSVTVYSGRDGTMLFRAYGPLSGDRLGYALAAAGDVDGDGARDVIAGAHHDGTLGPRAGAARVYSGIDGSQLLLLTRTIEQDDFGASVAGPGDLDGDGLGDLLVGAPRSSIEFVDGGGVTAFSGATGAVLHHWTGTAAGGRFGWSVDSAGDLDDDGFPEILVGSITEGNGAVRAFDLGVTGTPARALRFGRPCPGTPGRLPRVTLRGSPRVGQTFRLGVRGAPPDEPDALLLLGEFPLDAPLDPLGLPGCAIHLEPYILIPLATDPDGMAGIDLFLPFLTTPVGGTVFAQWLIVDPGAPYPLPLTLSDAFELTIGG